VESEDIRVNHEMIPLLPTSAAFAPTTFAVYTCDLLLLKILQSLYLRNPDKNALRAHTRLYLEYWYKILEIKSIHVNTISTQQFTELSVPGVLSKILMWKIVPYD
jgi:hypothetical protein